MMHLFLVVVYLLAAVVADDAVCSVGDEREECVSDSTKNNNDIDDEDRTTDACIDEDEGGMCKRWAKDGECEANPGYMLLKCRRSCKVCESEFSETDFGKPQFINPAFSSEIKQILLNSIGYMHKLRADSEYDIVIDECINTDERCSEWAIRTGCDDNPNYMKMNCAPACQSCEYLLKKKIECMRNPLGTDAIEAGGMDAMFEHMIKVGNDNNWQPTVLSRPTKIPCNEDDITKPCNIPDGPWVITLENFLSSEEISLLLDWGANFGYERSQAGDEIIEARTSAHAWCIDDCYEDPKVQEILLRIQLVTGVPMSNYEMLQLLKYVTGTYYKPHNDFIEKHITQSHGPRLLTFFIYFNEVAKGGGTRFTRLDGLTVDPKPGRVLIWPSILDSDLLAEEKRTEHEALAVEEGEKYAANVWIHTRDFQTPFAAACPS